MYICKVSVQYYCLIHTGRSRKNQRMQCGALCLGSPEELAEGSLLASIGFLFFKEQGPHPLWLFPQCWGWNWGPQSNTRQLRTPLVFRTLSSNAQIHDRPTQAETQVVLGTPKNGVNTELSLWCRCQRKCWPDGTLSTPPATRDACSHQHGNPKLTCRTPDSDTDFF